MCFFAVFLKCQIYLNSMFLLEEDECTDIFIMQTPCEEVADDDKMEKRRD